MTFLGKRLAVSIPDTVCEDKDSPREKTAKLGLMARACAVYGVDLIEVFHVVDGPGEGAQIRRVLEYLETPQYLRRRLYPMDESLRYAGLLPPLRIPSHKPRVPVQSLKAGEVREGVSNGDGTVDVGLETAPKLAGENRKGVRLTARITSIRPFLAEMIPRREVPEYWGYLVEERQPQEVFLDGRFEFKIATSRVGSPLSSVIGDVRKSVGKAKSIKLVFGSPTRGLFEIFGRGLQQKADMVLNLFPEQHVQTVRTEEAIFAGLGLVGLISSEKA